MACSGPWTINRSFGAGLRFALLNSGAHFMPKITGAHHTSFTVADVDRSVHFLRDVLGLELVFQREVKDAYFGRIVGFPGCVVKAALLRLPGSTHQIELFAYSEPMGTPIHPRP